jgi:hypothetical protein
VYHLADTCQAPDKPTARANFRKQYPDAQETGLLCIGPVKEPKRPKTPNTERSRGAENH